VLYEHDASFTKNLPATSLICADLLPGLFDNVAMCCIDPLSCSNDELLLLERLIFVMHREQRRREQEIGVVEFKLQCPRMSPDCLPRPPYCSGPDRKYSTLQIKFLKLLGYRYSSLNL
jgi:hypothetical protein